MSDHPDPFESLAKLMGWCAAITAVLTAALIAVMVLIDPGAINAVIGVGIGAVAFFGYWLAARIVIARERRR